ncbi:integrase catalytic domain-containing protein [Trichonephila clavipes]|nr:integrase catalytic domain-containing protein [Trichonephila clavipes]
MTVLGKNRGHSSNLVLGIIIDILSGLVLDFEVLSKYYKNCVITGRDMGVDTLSSDTILEADKTQNSNESLHTCIWRKCPKEVFVSKKRLEIAVVATEIQALTLSAPVYVKSVSPTHAIHARVDGERIKKKRLASTKDGGPIQQLLSSKTWTYGGLSYTTFNARKAQGGDVLRFTDPGTKFKLPNIELPTFDGKPRDWLNFWTQFEKIHDDVNIDDRDKFQYLIQSTAPRSSPREIVGSFPATAANYN